MRAIRLFGLLVFGIAAICIVPAITTGQFPGGKKGGGFKGMDAGSLFDMMARGKPSIAIADLRGWQAQMAAQYAQQKGITNGMLTRAQFIEFQDQARASKGPRGPFGFPGGPGQSSNVTIIQQNQSSSPDVLNQLADADFKRRDKNGDGKLNQDEMSPFLRKDLAKWDKNGDGFIDMYEYREYYMARLAGDVGGRDDTRGIASIVIEEEELDRKPVVFRAGGKMPPGLPSWFMELDTDGDGQVALYEWRKAGKKLDEFSEWDLNDDGFITPDEAVKHLASIGGAASSPGQTPSAAFSSPGYAEQVDIGPRKKGKGGDRPPGDFKKKKKGKGGGGE
jgi:hypothetical protein